MAQLFLFLGLIVLIIAIFWNISLSKYEFKNRTDGGVIEFPSYGASQWHYIKRKICDLLILASSLAIVFSILFLVLSE